MKFNIILHWLPRILCILAILFISLFAADSFTPGLTILEQLAAFFMHLIPSFVLVAFLLVAWKWERIGGIIFIALGLGFSPVVFMMNFNRNHSIGISLGIILAITFPFILVGILFLLSYRAKRKNLTTH